MANHLSYLISLVMAEICTSKSGLDFTCIEIMTRKKSNIIVRAIYRHPSKDVVDFDSNYLNQGLNVLLNKISKEKEKYVPSYIK